MEQQVFTQPVVPYAIALPIMEGVATLAGKLKLDDDWMRESTRLMLLAQDWANSAERANRLLSGPDIQDAKDWLSRKPAEATVTELHRDFIKASDEYEALRKNEELESLMREAELKSEKIKLAEEAAEYERQKSLAQTQLAKSAKKQSIIISTVSFLIVMSCFFSVFFYIGQLKLAAQKDEVEQEKKDAIFEKNDAVFDLERKIFKEKMLHNELLEKLNKLKRAEKFCKETVKYVENTCKLERKRHRNLLTQNEKEIKQYIKKYDLLDKTHEDREIVLNRALIKIGVLRSEIGRLLRQRDSLLAENRGAQIKIEDLRRRLNVALAKKIQQLYQERLGYSIEQKNYFYDLKRLLTRYKYTSPSNGGVKFRAQLFFLPRSVKVSQKGRLRLKDLAKAIKIMVQEGKQNTRWLLRVGVHSQRTNVVSRAPRNWEFSTKRSIAILKVLEKYGVPSARMFGAGFDKRYPFKTETDDRKKLKGDYVELFFVTR